MNKTIGLEIDGKKIYAETGTTILEAARQNGITIPTLCFHPRVKPLGHCRVCIVLIEGLDRPVTSCDNPVTEGMKVTTNTPELTAMRNSILELSLATHPYKDCLTCVRTGTCELQENAYRFQTDLPEQLERDIPAEDDGDNYYIVRDEEKCILCGRCIQICRSGPGAFVYEMINTGVNTRVVPYRDGKEVSMEEAGCIFCGQCVDVCPVAALTEQGRSSGGREWELSSAAGVCIECSLGCYLERQVSGDKLIKVTVPAEGDKVSWLCIRGKFGHREQNGGDPQTNALKLNRKSGGYEEITPGAALEQAAGALLAIKEKHGAESLAVLSSGRLSIEENYLLQKLARDILGTPNVDLGAEAAWVKAFSGIQDTVGIGVPGPTPAEVSRADSILVIGSGLEESHPVAAMAVGQAGRYGDAVVIRTAGGEEIPSAWKGIPLGVEDGSEVQLTRALLEMVRGGNSEEIAAKTSFNRADLERIADLITRPKSFLVVCPSYINNADPGAVKALLDLARESGLIEKGRSRMLLLSAYSNAAGVLAAGGTPAAGPGFTTLTGDSGLNRAGIAAAAKAGKVKGVLNFGSLDPELKAKNPGFLVAAGVPREDGGEADLLLPAQGVETKEGLFINASGMTRLNRAALKPGGEDIEDWRLICELARHLGAKWNYASLEEVREEMEA